MWLQSLEMTFYHKFQSCNYVTQISNYFFGYSIYDYKKEKKID